MIAVHDPVLELLSDSAQDVAADRIDFPISVEEADHTLGLLEWLDQSIQEQPIEAPISERNCYPCDARKRRSWEPPSGQIPGAYS